MNAADLIKNKILARCREKRTIDEAVENWGQIISSVGEGEIVNFLRYYWIAFHGNVRQRELYKAFEGHLNKLSPKQALDLARDLKMLAKIYQHIVDPPQDKQVWKSGVNEILKRLVIYKARSCRSVLMACAKNRPEEMLAVATACEVITVRYSVVSNMSSNELERSYAQLARALKNKQKDIKEIINEHLSTHSLTDEDFERNFSDLNISTVTSVWRQILVQLNDQLSTGETTVQDAQKVHVEHILPRNPGADAMRESQIQNKEQVENLSCMIGNLTLLSGDFNRKASNHAFSTKNKAFTNSEIALNKEIANKVRWGEKEIKERNRRLANLALNVWAWPIK